MLTEKPETEIIETEVLIIGGGCSVVPVAWLL